MQRQPKVKFEQVKVIKGSAYNKHIILADANVPSKLSIDRLSNTLFFCINADEFSDQSFHLVVLDLNTGLNAIIPGIQNGFASAVEPEGAVYLGGSNGIFEFNYRTFDVYGTAILKGVDIFDMYFHKYLYFVETATQNLFVWKNGGKTSIKELEGYGIQHFLVNNFEDILFVNSSGVYMLRKGTKLPITFGGASTTAHFRGMTADINGLPYLIAQDGIYTIDMTQRHVVKTIPMENIFGLAFDKDNNMVYSDERSVVKLILQHNPVFVNKNF